MNQPPPHHAVDSIAALEALLGPVGDASLKKEVDHLHPVYRQWIAASPFAVLATAGPGGLDASPRGDPPSLVQVQDEKTLLLPERRGNQRADSLRNIVVDPRVALLFMIPGIGETLRVNGHATISTAPDLLDRFVIADKPPLCVVVIRVVAVYFQCARAIQRSGLWAPRAVPATVPTAGAMLAALTQHAIDGAAYDRELPARQRATLY